jgi:hypothetical protein
LAFHLEDSASFRAFARLPHAWSLKKSVLHKTVSAMIHTVSSGCPERCKAGMHPQ